MQKDQPQRIMVVDDDPDIRNIARIALETIGGFTIETCASGEEAVSAIAGFGPDMVLLDAMMPGMDGPDTFQALSRAQAEDAAPVVFFTGRVEREDLKLFEELGAIGVVEKPFDPVSLAEEVRGIWARRPA